MIGVRIQDFQWGLELSSGSIRLARIVLENDADALSPLPSGTTHPATRIRAVMPGPVHR